jgi:cell division protein ZapE
VTSIADRYRALISERKFESDAAQAKLVGKLDALADKLKGYKAEGKPSGFSRLFSMKPTEPPRGLYIHGPVGRGKTMLMDMFFDAVEAPGAFSRLHG